ncbi:MAG: PcfJ domain-containing protein [Magnetococcales bacterium]|nr:PcfJ domain-containing protein [Magnetococcales bacterium]
MIVFDISMTHYDQKHGFRIDFRPHIEIIIILGFWWNSIPIFRSIDGEIYENVSEDIEIPIFQDPRQLDSGTPLRQYLESFPFYETIFSKLSNIRSHQLTMLRLCLATPTALDLLSCNPNLLWLVAHRIIDRKIIMIDAISVIHKKQSEILKWVTLGVACTRSDIKLIRKFHLDYEEDNFDIIIKVFREPKILCLVKSTNSPIHIRKISNIFYYKEMFDTRFFCNVFRESVGPILFGYIKKLHRCWQDTLQIGRLMRIPNYEQVVNQCPTESRLKNLHDRWFFRFNMEKNIQVLNYFLEKYGSDELPPPPLVGDELGNIVPITTISELLKEGRVMRHCVGGYVSHVIEKKCYIYKVLFPERATLSVGINDQNLTVIELKLAYNKEPSSQTRLLVDEFVRKRG